MGFRVFEVDLALTSDGHIVCYHGNDNEAELSTLTYDGYLDTVRTRGLQPCQLVDLLEVARRHPGVHFILDVKNRFEETYKILRKEIRDASLARAFIPQVYSFEEVAPFRRDPFFAGEIFTSYRSSLTTEQMFRRADRLGIRVVTLTLHRFMELRGQLPSNLHVFTHPVDDPLLAALVRKAGARGIYTSYLTPKTLPELFAHWSAGCQPPEEMHCQATREAVR